MGKPSIFSKDYESRMKKRRKRITFGIIIVVIAGAFVTIPMKGMTKNLNKNLPKLNITSSMKGIVGDLSKNLSKSKNSITTDKNNVKSTENKKVEAADQQKSKKTDAYDIQLSNGKTVSIYYETKNNEKVFKQASATDNSNTLYSISPSGKKAILFDDKVQSIILVDINGDKKDVTNPQYTSTSGNVIEKNAQLTAQPNYIWCSSPRFIDDNNIAYISQLPWIGKTTKYVWIETLENKSNFMVQEIQGEELKLEGLTDKGITVVQDGKTLFLKSDGSVSE